MDASGEWLVSRDRDARREIEAAVLQKVSDLEEKHRAYGGRL